MSLDHALPLKRRITSCSGPPFSVGKVSPTSMTSLAERAAMPVISGSKPGVGLGATLHEAPFPCSISVPPPTGLVLLVTSPAAQALVGEIATTAAIFALPPG